MKPIQTRARSQPITIRPINIRIISIRPIKYSVHIYTGSQIAIILKISFIYLNLVHVIKYLKEGDLIEQSVMSVISKQMSLLV